MSVAERINAERLVLLGWARAILLQFAHPLIAAGVRDHSGFRASPVAAISRLHHTVGAMLALTFGDAAEHRQAIDGIRAIHARVHGQLPAAVGRFPAGTCYSAEDPALVLWVHLTLVESVPLIYHHLVAPLTDTDRDAYCRESAAVAIELGARAEEVPRRWADARRQLDAMYVSDDLCVSDTARDLAGALLRPPHAWPLAPATRVNRLFTIGLLPPSIRDGYGFAWDARSARAFDRWTVVLRRARRIAPDMLALWPHARAAQRARGEL